MEALTAAEQNAQSVVSKALQAAKVYKYMPLGPVHEPNTVSQSTRPAHTNTLAAIYLVIETS